MFLGVNHRRSACSFASAKSASTPSLRRRDAVRPENGRVFRGTRMVEPELYKGDDRLATWFNLAMAHNATMEAKEAQEKPRKKKRAMASSSAATKDDDEEEVLEASDGGRACRPRRLVTAPVDDGRAICAPVLHVIQNIPPGKVAAYGQVAALAGAPRNARRSARCCATDCACAARRGTASSTRAREDQPARRRGRRPSASNSS